MHLSSQPTPSLQSDTNEICEQGQTNVPQEREIMMEPFDEKEDIRQLASEKFVSFDEFVHSYEFKTLLYKYRGRMLRRKVKEITPNIENDLLEKIQSEVADEMNTMTFAKGRQLLQDAGVIIVPGWHMRFFILFDSFIKDYDTKRRILPKDIDRIYSGFGFGPDKKALLQCALYPKKKMPTLILGTLLFRELGK